MYKFLLKKLFLLYKKHLKMLFFFGFLENKLFKKFLFLLFKLHLKMLFSLEFSILFSNNG